MAQRLPENSSLCSQFIPWKASERPRPSLYPQHQKVHDPVTRHWPQAQHRGGVYFCQIYSGIFWTQGSPSHTQQAHAQGQRNWSCFRVYLTPFTPFKSPFSSESRVKITLWLRLWSWGRTKKTLSVAASHLIVWLTYHSTVQMQIFIHRAEDVLYLKVKKIMKTNQTISY